MMTFNAERNGVGLQLSTGESERRPKLNFDVKRTFSEDLAKWFVEKAFLDNNGKSDGIPAKKKCTFGQDPGKLNFVFVGNLTVQLMQKPDFYPDSPIFAYMPVVFLGIVFAQGNIGSGHNWWFGGKTCNYKGDHKVLCEGLGADGKYIYNVEFRTGGGLKNNEVAIGEIKQFSAKLPQIVLSEIARVSKLADKTPSLS